MNVKYFPDMINEQILNSAYYSTEGTTRLAYAYKNGIDTRCFIIYNYTRKSNALYRF
jgi:hypothetical protein